MTGGLCCIEVGEGEMERDGEGGQGCGGLASGSLTIFIFKLLSLKGP